MQGSGSDQGATISKLSHGPDLNISVNDPLERRALIILLLGHATVVFCIITLPIILICLVFVGSVLTVAAIGSLGLACRLSLDFAVLTIIHVVVGTKADPPRRIACSVVTVFVALRSLVVDGGCW